MAQTPSKLQPARNQTAPKAKTVNKDKLQSASPEPLPPSADLAAGLERTPKVLDQTVGRSTAHQIPQSPLETLAYSTPAQIQEQTDRLEADKQEASTIQAKSDTEDQPVTNRISPSPSPSSHLSDSTLRQTPSPIQGKDQFTSSATMANTCPTSEV